MFRNTSLSKVVIGSLAMLALLNISSIFLLTFFSSGNEQEVDVAGRNRMLSQRMALFTNLYFHSNSPEHKKLAMAALETHDLSLERLRLGGPAPGMGEDKVLKPASEKVSGFLSLAFDKWGKYKTAAEMVMDGNSSSKEKEIALATLNESATSMLTINNELVKAYVNEAKGGRTKMLVLAFVGIAISLGIFGMALWVIQRNISLPMVELLRKSKSIIRGDYDQKVNYKAENEVGKLAGLLNALFFKFREVAQMIATLGEEGNDEKWEALKEKNDDQVYHALYETRLKLSEVNRQNAQRIWANEGYAKFAEIIRTENSDLQKLGKEVLRELVNYVGVNQGGVFVLEKDAGGAEILKMEACYAYQKQKFIRKEFELGEGLLSEVFFEKDAKYFKEIPDGYLEITSGLGKTNPKTIFICPLIDNEEVAGVMEIASFDELDEFKREFVEKVCASLAAAILDLNKAHELESLYAEASQRTEELRSQEEEMRQNMEELQATQEEMFRKEKEYVQVIEQLKVQLAEG